MSRSRIAIFILLLTSCSGNGNNDGSGAGTAAEVTEIGELGIPVPTKETGLGSGSVVEQAVSLLPQYEMTGQWVLLATPNLDPPASWLVNLDSGDVRGACREFGEQFLASHLFPETHDVITTGSIPWGTGAFRVNDGVIEAIFEDGVVRCQPGADAATPGTLVEIIPSQDPQGVSFLGHSVVQDDGVWAGPMVFKAYDGTETRTEWEDVSLSFYATNAAGTGFLVGATDFATNEVVAFETNSTGERTEFGRLADATVHSVTRTAVFALPTSTNGCTILRPGTEPVTVDLACGGEFTDDGEGYFQGKMWTALDGSRTIDHNLSDVKRLTRFGTVVRAQTAPDALNLWAAPIDEEPVPPPMGDIMNTPCTGNCDPNSEVVVHANGLCTIQAGPNPVVFDCTDATRSVVVTEGIRGGAAVGSNPTWTELPVFYEAPKRGKSENVLVVTADLKKRWIADDGIFEVGPRNGDEALSFARTLAIGYDGTLYRIDIER